MLRSHLPVIRIPLLERDEDAPLALQALVNQAYERGGYEEIDHSVDPITPLAGADAAWVREHWRPS